MRSPSSVIWLLAEDVLKITENLSQELKHVYVQWSKKWLEARMLKSTNDSQKIPADCGEAVSMFHSTMAHFQTRHMYTPYSICNMNRTLIRIDNLATHTNSTLGTSSIGCGA